MLQALLQRIGGAQMGVIPQLAGDEQIFTRNARAVNGFAHARLVLVGGGSINRTVADLNRFVDCGNHFFITGLPYAEAQLRHYIAIVQFNHGWMCHAFLLFISLSGHAPIRFV